MFNVEAETIYDIIDDVDYDFAGQQVMVPRYQGMEDSSRNWSMFMVLEHLCIVNQTILKLLDVLGSGVQPRGIIDIGDFKPDVNAGAESIDEFQLMVKTYNSQVNRLKPLKQPHLHVRFAHPWFGDLDAHQWHCLAAFHMRIHRKQIRKNAAMQGVV